MQSSQPSYIAGEDIGPSLFVFPTNSTDNTVEVAGAGVQACGVSGEYTREAPIPGITPLHAATGEPCQVYGLGDVCEVIAGGAIDAGDFLKPDAAGEAIAAVSTDEYSARALTDAADGEKCKVQIVHGVMA